MTKLEFAHKIHDHVPAIPVGKCEGVVDALFGEDGVIGDALAAGDEVMLTGFGKFHTTMMPAGVFTDSEGVQHPYPARPIPRFKAGQGLKDRVRV
jgi:nucleoid DNA-binding protein